MYIGTSAENHPDKVALIFGDTGATLTYRELDERSNRVAQALWAWGLRPGDAVAADVGWDIYMLKAGTCGLTASQAGNSSYNAAADVPVSFVVSKVSQTVSYAPPNKTFGDGAFSVDPATSAVGEGFTPSFSGGTSGVCSINSSTGEITIIGAGTCSVQADYPGNERVNTGSSGAKSFTVAKKDQSMSFSQSGKTFGDANFQVTASTDATGSEIGRAHV